MGTITIPNVETGSVSDGDHTFGELYEHRIELWIALCREMAANPDRPTPWRSRLHSDGSCFEGWFVLGLDCIEGKQITYHLPMNRWDDCGFAVQACPAFDGHTPADVLERLKRL